MRPVAVRATSGAQWRSFVGVRLDHQRRTRRTIPAYAASICHRQRVARAPPAMTAKPIIVAPIRPLPNLPAPHLNHRASEHQTPVDRIIVARSARPTHLETHLTSPIPKHQRAWFDARGTEACPTGAIACSVPLFSTGRGAAVPVAPSADVDHRWWALLISIPRPRDDALLILAGFQCKRTTYISSDTGVPLLEGGSAAADPTNEWRGIARCRGSSAPLTSVRRKDLGGPVR